MSSNARIQCQCGQVSLPASLPQPVEVYVCHCVECRKQSASAFGISAMFPSEGMWPLPEDQIPLIGVWSRPTDAGNINECYFCKKCGTRLFHRGILPTGQPKRFLSVKGGSLESLSLEGAIHIWTQSAIVPVPEGSHLREPPDD